MRDFFSLDGTFNKYGSYLADTFILSLMWLVFSIPLVTMGASTTAMFYVATRRIANREGYITSDFWQAFKANFKKATIIWLILAGLVLIMIFNIANIEHMGNMAGFMLMAQFVFIIIIALVSVFLFPMIARFEMGIIQILKSSFYMAIRHLFTSASCVLLLVSLFIISTDVFATLFFLAPGIYGMATSYMVMRIFRKYRPEIDPDPIAELQEIEAERAEERRKRDVSRIIETIDENKEEM